MKLVQIYQCLCDETRLRILHLLAGGELCVCHIQEVLGEPQVKVSKHLAYLRKHGMVAVRREANWKVYRVADRPTRALSSNMACLQDCAGENPVFAADMKRLLKLKRCLNRGGLECCAPASRVPTSASRRLP
jgi:DNA-binding transcriptional ArsR family regulator